MVIVAVSCNVVRCILSFIDSGAIASIVFIECMNWCGLSVFVQEEGVGHYRASVRFNLNNNGS